MFSTAVLTLVMVLCAQCFYLDGIIPLPYREEDHVRIQVNTLTSLSTIVPYSYYQFSLFCPPTTMYKRQESLGEVLWGDNITSSPYDAEMRKDWKCKLLDCQEDSNNKLWGRVNILDKLINEGYRGHMVVDNLPVFNNGTFVFGGRCKGQIPANQQHPFMRGYALGVHRGCIGETLVNNHLHFRFQYNQPDLDVKRYVVVGVSVTPYSVKHAPDGGDCDNDFDPTLASITPLTTKDLLLKTKPHWSYSVEWVSEPNIRWASRWDSYLHTSIANTNDRLHWVYIATNFFIIAIAIVAFMVCRHHSPDPDEIQEAAPVEVRRPPPHGSALAVFVGSGTQLFSTTALTLTFAMLGFLSPANRGALLTTLIMLFVMHSFVGGNVCARLLKMFELKSWKSIFFCAFTYPGITFIVYVLIDLVNWNVGASTAISFATMLTLLGLWIAAGIPLTILGASLGFRQSTIEYRVTTPEVDRESTVKWFWRPFIYIFPATFPFVVVFLELRLILDAIWLGMSYYVFGFLGLVFVEWTIAVSLTTIIVLYCQSCFEGNRWWWQSVVISGALGIVVFAYSVYYYFTALSITGATGTFLYFTYMAMVSAAFGVVSGAVGFLAAFCFARKINGSKKIESKAALRKAGGDASDVTEPPTLPVISGVIVDEEGAEIEK